MATMNEKLKEAAIKAITDYNGDSSVDINETREGLIEIRDELQSMIDAILASLHLL